MSVIADGRKGLSKRYIYEDITVLISGSDSDSNVAVETVLLFTCH